MSVSTQVFAANLTVNSEQFLPSLAVAIFPHGEQIHLQVAQTPQQQEMGLMYQSELPDDGGMLFPFSSARLVNFSMKNVLMPLDMIFLRDGIVQAFVISAPPCLGDNCPVYNPQVLVDSVIELRSGKINELSVKVGDRVLINSVSNYSETSSALIEASSVIQPGIDAPLPYRANRLIYALGTLGYDFGSEARRDLFRQGMPDVNVEGLSLPANPYDIQQVISYLEDHPAEAKTLIWTLNFNATPIYAIEPTEANAGDIYEILQIMLAGQIAPQESDDYIEQVSIPGKLSDRTVTLFSGQVIPVLEAPNVRGMYGWKVNALIETALETARDSISETVDLEIVRRSLRSFLNRVYHDLCNMGQTGRDRALNFAATNIFQATSTFTNSLVSGMQLDTIEVKKSPFCRYDSDCWEVKLKFFDPENDHRARRVFCFTLDVRDIMPVTLGEIKFWAEKT